MNLFSLALLKSPSNQMKLKAWKFNKIKAKYTLKHTCSCKTVEETQSIRQFHINKYTL